MKPPARKLVTPRDAEQFLARAGVALRYQAPAGFPVANLRLATGPLSSRPALDTSIRLTNHLLERRIGIEVMVVADRPALVHRSLLPALYALVRRGRPVDDYAGLSLQARQAAAMIAERGAVSAGDVRRALGVSGTTRDDPAYAALGELQRSMLVDRGPFVVPATGIPYLSREGYPYRFIHKAHPDLVRRAHSLNVDKAADRWIAAFLEGAPLTRHSRLKTIFKRFLSPTEIAASLQRLF